jgi:hypothetical protein
MDLPTSYGTRPLSPFAWTWFAEDWEPILDVYLLAILAAGLWFGRVPGEKTPSVASSKIRSRNAVLAIGLMMVNYGVRATAHHEAITRARQVFGAQLPAWCAERPGHSPLEQWPQSLAEPGAGSPRCVVDIAAMPDFLSPFRWRLIAQLSNAFEVRTVDLLDDGRRTISSDVRIVAVHYPNIWTPAVLQAAQTPMARVFLGFSRFPAARSTTGADGTATIRWSDLRFVSDTTPGLRERAPNLFSATIQLRPDGTVARQHLGP